jgi:hypothetical protein
MSTVLFEGLLDKHEPLKIIQNFSSRSKINVIYGLLHLFVSDPHIDKVNAKQLIKEMSSAKKVIGSGSPRKVPKASRNTWLASSRSFSVSGRIETSITSQLIPKRYL